MNKQFITLIVLSAFGISATAAPLCSQVLRASPTQEQIAELFDDLARMALDIDAEKAKGKTRSALRSQFRIKSSEAKEQLELNEAQLIEQLRPRIEKLQKIDESLAKEKAIQKEQQAESLRPPQFIKDQKNRIQDHSILDIAVFPDGHQKAIKLAPGVFTNKLVIETLLSTEKPQTVSERTVTAAIDRRNQRIVILGHTTKSDLEFRFVSMVDFKELSPPLKINISNFKAAGTKRGILTLSADGEGFTFSSRELGGSLTGQFKNIGSMSFAIERHTPYFLNSQDLLFTTGLAKGQYGLKMERQGQIINELVLPFTAGFPLKIQKYDNQNVAVIMPQEILIVSTADLNIVKTYKHNLADLVVVEDYVIGTLDGQVVMKSLHQMDSPDSLLDFSGFAESNFNALNIHLIDDGKSLAIQGADVITGTNYFYILNRAGDKP